MFKTFNILTFKIGKNESNFTKISYDYAILKLININF